METGKQDWMEYGLIGKTQMQYETQMQTLEQQHLIQSQQDWMEKSDAVKAYKTEMKLQALYTVLDSIQNSGTVVTADMISKDTYKICKERYGISEKELKSLVKDAQEGKVPELEYRRNTLQEGEQHAPFQVTRVEEKEKRVSGNHRQGKSRVRQKVFLNEKSAELQEGDEIVTQGSFKMKQKAVKKNQVAVNVLTEVLKTIRRQEGTAVTQAVKIPKEQIGMYKKKFGMSEKELEQLSLEIQSELAPVVEEEVRREREELERRREQEARERLESMQKQEEEQPEEEISMRRWFFNKWYDSERIRAINGRFNRRRRELDKRYKDVHKEPVKAEERTIGDLEVQISEKSNWYLGINPEHVVSKYESKLFEKRTHVKELKGEQKQFEERLENASFLTSVVSEEHLKMMNDYVKTVEKYNEVVANQQKMMTKEGVDTLKAYERKLEKEIADALKKEAKKRGTKEPIAMNSTELLSKLSVKKTIWEQEKKKIQDLLERMQKEGADLNEELENLPENEEKSILSSWIGKDGNGVAEHFKRFGLKTSQVDKYLKGKEQLSRETTDLNQLQTAYQTELKSYNAKWINMKEKEREELKSEIEQLMELRWQKEVVYKTKSVEEYIQNRCELVEGVRELGDTLLAELDEKLANHPELASTIEQQKRELREIILREEVELYEAIRNQEFAHYKLCVEKNGEDEIYIQSKGKRQLEALLARREAEQKAQEAFANSDKGVEAVNACDTAKEEAKKAYKEGMQEIHLAYREDMVSYEFALHGMRRQELEPAKNVKWVEKLKKIDMINENDEEQEKGFTIYDVELGKFKMDNINRYIDFMRNRYQNRMHPQE